MGGSRYLLILGRPLPETGVLRSTIAILAGLSAGGAFMVDADDPDPGVGLVYR